jgi:phosphate transport system substrate-binding protein
MKTSYDWFVKRHRTMGLELAHDQVTSVFDTVAWLEKATQSFSAKNLQQTKHGSWVMPKLASTTSAAQSVASIGLPAGSTSWTNVNILNAPGANSYPIVSFSYIIVCKELNVIPGITQAEATAFVQWLWNMVHDGQNLASPLSYAPLPSNVVTIN